jgi:sugar-specific transcriptional regulator TrmB
METSSLERIGLSESDVKIYLALLGFGSANVTQLAEASGVHRTNIYSILDKLKEMGLVTEAKEENKLRFKVSDPENLLNYIKESEEAIRILIPDLNKIRESVKEKIEVNVFKGEKGIKSAMKDILRERKEVVGFGMTGQLRHYMPAFAVHWIRDIQKRKIHNRYIYIEKTEISEKNFEVRSLPKEFSTPVGTQIYGDKVLITIWEPTYVAIMIKSREVADNYRKYFGLLWKIAKK